MTGAFGHGEPAMRNGIGQFIKTPVTDKPGPFGANNELNPLREHNLITNRSRNVCLICTCIAAGCRAPVGLGANNSQCVMERSHLRPSHPIFSRGFETTTHLSAHSPTLLSTGRRGPHPAKSRSRDILAGGHWTARGKVLLHVCEYRNIQRINLALSQPAQAPGTIMS